MLSRKQVNGSSKRHNNICRIFVKTWEIYIEYLALLSLYDESRFFPVNIKPLNYLQSLLKMEVFGAELLSKFGQFEDFAK